MEVGRFAPSTTGPPHPGTLLAALLCWLDARSRSACLALRLEDLDPQRSRPEWARAMAADLAWLGLDWDSQQLQSEGGERHAAALDHLGARGLLYPCSCSRAQLRAAGERAPDGGWRYSNVCRFRSLPGIAAGGWRASEEALRVRLPDESVEVTDEAGGDSHVSLSGRPARDFGDPVVRRRDGAVAYHLASVVDDQAVGVTRVVRGRDLAPSTAIQVALQRLLDYPTPLYRHHLLLLEERGEKLAKLHGAVAVSELRGRYAADELCGVLACAAGLIDEPRTVTPAELLADFAWQRVAHHDRVLRFTGERLELGASAVDQGTTTSRSEDSPGTPSRRGKP